jgi:hypothetical protein
MMSSTGGGKRWPSVSRLSKFSVDERLGEKVQLDPDFREFVESFVANDVRFLIVGGYAIAAHGLPRYTGDLDAWIWVSPQNAERVIRSLEQFGFSGLGLTRKISSNQIRSSNSATRRIGETSSRQLRASSLTAHGLDV